MTKYDILGTVTITEPQAPFTENHTYYAADHRTVQVLPGTYEVRLTKDGSPQVLVTVDAEITNDTTYSGVGGVNYASTTREPHRGTKTFQMYDYSVADTLCKGTAFLGGEFRFAEGVTIEVAHMSLPLWESETGKYSDTKTRTHVSRKFKVSVAV